MTNDSGPNPGPNADSGEPSSERADSADARPYLLVACSVVALEAVALLILAGFELAATESDRAGLGVSTAIFFVVIGVGLGWFAICLWRRASWARGPVVFAQLVQLGLAWNFREVSPRVIAIALLLTAVVTLAAVLAPATTAALTDDPEPADD